MCLVWKNPPPEKKIHLLDDLNVQRGTARRTPLSSAICKLNLKHPKEEKTKGKIITG